MRSTRSWQVHLAGVLGALALVGAGCGSGHPKPNRNGDAYVYLTWTVADVGSPTVGLYCEDVGAGEVEVALSNSQGTYTDTFPCNSQGYSGTGAYLPSGTYSVRVSLYGDVNVYGNNTTVLDQFPDFTYTVVSGANDIGAFDFALNSFVLGWNVSVGGLPTTCLAVGGRYVELDVYFVGLGQTQATAYYLDCTGYNPAATLAIPAGTYGIRWQAFLLDASYYDVPGTFPTPLADYTVNTGLQADLGTAYFAF